MRSKENIEEYLAGQGLDPKNFTYTVYKEAREYFGGGMAGVENMTESYEWEDLPDNEATIEFTDQAQTFRYDRYAKPKIQKIS